MNPLRVVVRSLLLLAAIGLTSYLHTPGNQILQAILGALCVAVYVISGEREL